MAALNVNSLVAHIDELRVFMSSSGIDILVINETKLNFLVDNNEVHLQGFEIIRKDRKTNGRNGGGVCIYVRSNLNYIIRDDLRTFAPIVSAHPYCARKCTRHVIHERAR